MKKLLIRSAIVAVLLATVPSLSVAQQVVVDFNVVGLNSNQTTAVNQITQACASLGGEGAEQTAGLQEACDLIDSLDPNNPEDARQLQKIGDAIAPEEIFALNDSLVALSDFQTTNIHSRLNALRSRLLTRSENDSQNGSGGDSSSNAVVDEVKIETASMLSTEFNLTDPLPAGGGASGDLVSRLGGFVNGHLSSGEFDGERLQQDADTSSSSLTFGSDYRFNNNVIAGLGLGVLQNEATFSQVDGGTEAEGLNFTAFATWYESNLGYADIVLDVGRVDYDLERSVTILSDAPQLTAVSSPSSTATSLTISAGRNWTPFGWDLGGYLRLSLTRANIDAYSESLKSNGQGFAALFSVGQQSVVSTTMTVGLELSKAINTTHAIILPLLRLEYVNENESQKDDIEATLISTGTIAQYEGEDRVSGYSNLGIGASAVFSGGRNIYAYYETHLQHDVISQDWLKAGVRLEF